MNSGLERHGRVQPVAGLRTRQRFLRGLIAALVGAAVISAQPSVSTYHNDNARTGQYLNEILLKPADLSAGRFTNRHFWMVDGAVYAQPLYLSRVKLSGRGFHNVVFVATSHDSLYAFDADDPNAAPLWQVRLLNAKAGETSVSGTDVGCSVMPELGISGTPVIDVATGTIYLITYTKSPGPQYIYRLHALDVTSGAERPGSPVDIQTPGFVPFAHKQRTALLLEQGQVYSSWSGNCDLGTYHGWLMAHDEKTLEVTSFFNSSPGDSGASFWNGGAGPAADEQGNIYVVSANGDFDGNFSESHYDESVLKFSAGLGLSPTDQFTPFNKLSLDAMDLDLGSSGALILPHEAGSAIHQQLLLTAGKEGRIYLLDRQALGGAQADSDIGAVQELPVLGNSIFGSAAYFNRSVYIAPTNSPLLALPIVNATVQVQSSPSSSPNAGGHGATPSVSANGSDNGIVWMIGDQDNGRLLAYDATNLTDLYESSALVPDGSPGYAEFSVPTIADGKVFVPTYGGVAVFGETPPQPPVVTGVVNAASYAPDAISAGSLISIFGSNLAGKTASASATPLPMSLADTSVLVNGIPAPILFESPGQINAQVPWEVSPGSATIVVRTLGTSSAGNDIKVETAAPGLFTTQGGFAAALNADGTVNSQTNPAASGSIVSIFFTGQGAVSSAVDDGDAPVGDPVSTASNASASIGGLAAQVKFSGLAPGYPGLAQINLSVPALASGTYPLIVTIAGKASQPAQLAVASRE